MNTLKHLGIIMDGNRRWARQRAIPIIFGHKKGADKLFHVCDWCIEYDIKMLTVYVFSTKNWNRTTKEIKNLFRLIEVIFNKEIDNFKKKSIKVNIIGDYEKIEKNCVNILNNLKDETKYGERLVLNLAINYGGKEDIISAIKKLFQSQEDINNLNEDVFSKYLSLSPSIPIDLLIRTGSHHRLSNFCLWEMSDSEIYITDILWPDFEINNFKEAISFYKTVQINNGK